MNPLPPPTRSNNEEDARLMARLAAGDRGAFSPLYDRHAPLVLGLACRMLRRREDAEDILQNVFWTMWTKAGSYNASRGPVVAWLMVICRSRCLDRLRRTKANPVVFEEAPEDLRAEENPAHLDALASAERRAEVAGALAALPAPQREAVEAAFFDGLTQREIAEKTQEPLGTVKTRMRLGLMKLAEIFRQGERS